MITKTHAKYFILAILLQLHIIFAQNTTEVKQVSASLNQFALKFLAETSRLAGNSLNIALSPYTIWSLLVIIREGAREKTALELENVLGIPSSQDKNTFHKSYESFGNNLNKKNDSGVTLDTTSSIYTTSDQELKLNFRQIVESVYKADVASMNFSDTINSANMINKRIYEATNGRINNFIQPQDLMDARVFMTSTLYFKGRWDKQFNKSETKQEPFYDEKNNEIGKVDMMYDSAPYPFSLIFDNSATAVELPYKGNTMGMILVLPKRSIGLQKLLDDLVTKPFTEITDALDKAVEYFGDEPVHVFIPKFRTTSDLNLNYVLFKMGLQDIFSEKDANLSGMFNKPLFVSRVIQKAEIEVDEEGTVASSASGIEFEYKSPPARFVANRPFAYIIYDKITKGIVFVGKISIPN